MNSLRKAGASQNVKFQLCLQPGHQNVKNDSENSCSDSSGCDSNSDGSTPQVVAAKSNQSSTVLKIPSE